MALSGFPFAEILWGIGVVIGLIIVWNLATGPRWNVWASRQKGLADLAQANNEQQIQIARAKSRLQAAELNKQAAMIEAQAVSAQIREIDEHPSCHDLYLRWQ